MSDIYYKEKLFSLFGKLFIETGDARTRFRNCESKVYATYLASTTSDVPDDILNRWKKIWQELNTKPELKTYDGHVISSSFSNTVKSKRNKSLEKYLLFILEEVDRVRNA